MQIGTVLQQRWSLFLSLSLSLTSTYAQAQVVVVANQVYIFYSTLLDLLSTNEREAYLRSRNTADATSQQRQVAFSPRHWLCDRCAGRVGQGSFFVAEGIEGGRANDRLSQGRSFKVMSPQIHCEGFVMPMHGVGKETKPDIIQ